MRRGSVVVLKDEKNMTTDSCKGHEATKVDGRVISSIQESYQQGRFVHGEGNGKMVEDKLWKKKMHELLKL